MPKTWYNIAADLPTMPNPPLHPGTKQPLGPEDLAPLFPMALIEQEMSAEREIAIPEPVQEALKLWRPSPLIRATGLEKALGTPAKIYYKYEGVSPAGSHKPNTALAQAYYNKQEGVKRITTETGAGQWGSSMALAGQLFDLEVKVYMVKISYEQKPYRRSMMKSWGADIVPSPSTDTEYGRKVLAADPDSNGSLGIAISEAIEDAVQREDTKYTLGSVLNHVLLHQTVIGLETKKQMEIAGDIPDIVIGCVGGGSNFAGLAFPYLRDKINGADIEFRAIEPSACPTLTRGKFTYDFGDTAQMTPLVTMYTLGHTFMPPGIHAGGLRYHGMAPMLSHVVKEGLVDAYSFNQVEVFDAATLFAKTEGIIPAPESSHAIKGAVNAALEAKEAGEEKVILFNLSGHGHFDMTAYDAYFAGQLTDYSPTEKDLEVGFASTEGLPPA
ncbi:MAG: TrpB-like pyridoxal phosphate-dependent enzyme [Candidatus Marinimicrobia bacterium]|nr:TrpB-like pyridoxal phosphate-dependent enzyme [Candidatus Neomarinimicrobiota bacterium]MCF7851546.1 TrpB-like pyridoxal phosphate-dependent enzyme [Candidatus Neomarinimicrobiota bacterium]MCF7905303.1 TrpB-like pyridoxal phosphate-dependent enzyme [Candidatus Neomarinimicrobiota bacterium]